MGAIAAHWGVAQGAATAFEAGADILLICKDQKYVLESLELIRGRVLRSEIPFQRLNTSYERIMRVRSTLLDRKEWISMGNVKRYFKLSA
jgi:beta-N-acetylhexosaminidase